MDIILAILILIGSFLLILWGGDRFVNASIYISKKLKIPSALIGATITSIGTTLPELLVTIFASGGESAGIAVGNALGSIAFNGAVIGGILLIFTIINLKDTGKTSAVLLVFAVLLTFTMSLNKNISLWECLILISIFVIFMILNYLKARKISTANSDFISEDTKPIAYYLMLFLIAGIALGIGAYFLVDKAKFLAGLAGMSETVIGLTIVSIGTSLPELITTINSIRKKEAGLGLGNIIGSNIINCTLLMSLSSIISGSTSGMPVDMQTMLLTLPITLLITTVLILPTIIQGKTHKWQGYALIGIYLLYYIFLFLTGLNVINIF